MSSMHTSDDQQRGCFNVKCVFTPFKKKKKKKMDCKKPASEDYGNDDQELVVRMFADKVNDFSSQYGGENNISYTVQNITKDSSIYPGYGDFTQACVFRTYGPWWDLAPAACKSVKKTPENFVSIDFIELIYEQSVYPLNVLIYETFNPGAVVRILGGVTSPGSEVVQWQIMWSGKPEAAPRESRIFNPKICRLNVAINMLRIEFNSCFCWYYTELDAVELIGLSELTTTYKERVDVNLFDSDLSLKNTINSLSTLTLENDTPVDYISSLPSELMQLILSYLDVRSLCLLSSVSSLLNKHAYDSMQYTDLNLKPYWTKLNNLSLNSLLPRCSRLHTLDLGWCGSHGMITSSEAVRFLGSCSETLGCLRLACCRFVDDVVLKCISTLEHLTELDLQCCKNIYNFLPLATTTLNLKRLNLYRTRINTEQMIDIIRTKPNLLFLNLGACQFSANFHRFVIELGENCKSIRGLDFWRLNQLSDPGLLYIAENCRQLEDLDIGWCGYIHPSSGSVASLIKNCTKLKKLFLTANRGVGDAEILLISDYLPDLEQLDILGTSRVTAAALERVFLKCKKMKFVDVSFCAKVDFLATHNWKKVYPHIEIKKSFQS